MQKKLKKGELQFLDRKIIATFGSGQQPYPPWSDLQQVSPEGHVDLSSGHSAFGTGVVIGRFKNGNERFPLMHFPAATSHFVFCGQQCSPSEQHTA